MWPLEHAAECHVCSSADVGGGRRHNSSRAGADDHVGRHQWGSLDLGSGAVVLGRGAEPTVIIAAPPAPAKDGGTFKFNLWTDDPPSLDPYVNVSFRVQEFAAFHYSRLLMSKKAPGVAGQAYIMEGDLAESWKPSDDGKTWTFNLRQNATWHNLDPMGGRP